MRLKELFPVKQERMFFQDKAKQIFEGVGSGGLSVYGIFRMSHIPWWSRRLVCPAVTKVIRHIVEDEKLHF